MSGAVSRETSVKIVNLSFFFVLLVVAGHVGWCADGVFGQVVRCVLVRSLARVSIPFFFAVSGFFLAAHFQEPDWWRRAVRRRVGTLLAPYVFWLTVYALVMLAWTGRWVAGAGGFGFNPCRLPMVGPLWYVRCLMAFVLFSPLLKRAVERWGLWWIGAAYLVNVVLSVLTGRGILEYEAGLGGLLGYGVSIEGIVYFSAGIYLQAHPLRGGLGRVPALALLTGVLLVAVRAVLEGCHVALPLHPSVLISPFLLVGLWRYAPARAWPAWLSACTFPIYLVHAIVLNVLWQAGLLRNAVGQWSAFALGIAVPIALYHVMRKYLPRVSTFAFGGR